MMNHLAFFSDAFLFIIGYNGIDVTKKNKKSESKYKLNIYLICYTHKYISLHLTITDLQEYYLLSTDYFRSR